MPKLLKKHYSDEVDYDFVKIDDIFELLNPAFTKYHICSAFPFDLSGPFGGVPFISGSSVSCFIRNLYKKKYLNPYVHAAPFAFAGESR